MKHRNITMQIIIIIILKYINILCWMYTFIKIVVIHKCNWQISNISITINYVYCILTCCSFFTHIIHCVKLFMIFWLSEMKQFEWNIEIIIHLYHSSPIHSQLIYQQIFICIFTVWMFIFMNHFNTNFVWMK